MIEDLKSQYPEIMKRVIAFKINERLNNSWTQTNYDNGHYVGHVNSSNRRNEKRAYQFTSNKTIFIGQWNKCVRRWVGTYMKYNLTIMYEGEYLKNNFFGKGKYYFDNVNTYDGDFVDDKWCGKGTLTYKNDFRWEGPFVKD